LQYTKYNLPQIPEAATLIKTSPGFNTGVRFETNPIVPMLCQLATIISFVEVAILCKNRKQKRKAIGSYRLVLKGFYA
jgi:hypothetical protein